MEILVRDSHGYVHRRFEDISMNVEEVSPDEEVVEESDLVDISSEAWCKNCFEMDNIEGI